MTRLRTLRLFCSVALLPWTSSGAQSTPLLRQQVLALDSQLPLLLKKHRVAAVGAAIIRDGRIVWTKVYGEQGPGVAATPQTMFNVASLTATSFQCLLSGENSVAAVSRAARSITENELILSRYEAR
jgi:CubicO group peptidase (beta-lactamase class C family)